MSPKHEDRICPACGGAMRRGGMAKTVNGKGRLPTHAQPGWHRAPCDEGVLDGEDNLVPDAALHKVMAHAHARR